MGTEPHLHIHKYGLFLHLMWTFFNFRCRRHAVFTVEGLPGSLSCFVKLVTDSFIVIDTGFLKDSFSSFLLVSNMAFLLQFLLTYSILLAPGVQVCELSGFLISQHSPWLMPSPASVPHLPSPHPLPQQPS